MSRNTYREEEHKDTEDEHQEDARETDEGEHEAHDTEHGRSEVAHHRDAPDLYRFRIVDGAVQGVSEIDEQGEHPDTLEANESYRLDGNEVIRSEWHAGGEEVTRFTPNADGSYSKQAKQWLPGANTPADAPRPHLEETLCFEGSDGDDLIAVATSQSALGHHGADRFVIRELGHLTIDDFDHAEGDQVVFDTGLGLQSMEHLLQFVSGTRHEGDDLIVDFGTDVSITLVGALSRGIELGDFHVLS
jgi:hypothetical protein